MKKYTMMMMAFALLLGMTQCKKETTNTNNDNTEGISITLQVDNGDKGDRLNVYPSTGAVVFTQGDEIYVGNNGKYVGTLTYRQGLFQGTISDEGLSTDDYLHFYFVGNKPTSPTTLSAGTTSYTVDISNQSTGLPAISYAPSTAKYSPSITAYTAKLLNKSALVKFDFVLGTSDAVTVANMLTTATIDFATPGITPVTNTTGDITLYSESETAKWAVLLPQDDAISSFTVNIGDKSYTVNGSYSITNNGYIDSGIMVEDAVNLANLTADYEAQDGDVLTGTLTTFHKISVAEGATVTFKNVQINPNDTYVSSNYAGIHCTNNATLVFEGSNVVKAWNMMPGIYIAQNKTLTIRGTGSLTASTSKPTAAIGAGQYTACGNIVIEGGDITATATSSGAAIGGGNSGGCGNITISGGDITATATSSGAAIGCGHRGGCGNITISGGNITATSSGASGIGAGYLSSCGNINISAGTVNATGSHSGIGGGYSGGGCGTITISGGTIIASGNYGAGIGSGNGSGGSATCSGISISGGDVTASSNKGAGIGAGYDEDATCGEISITGGTITATGGYGSAGIGASRYGSCSGVNISNSVTKVTATKGSSAPCSIGYGAGFVDDEGGSCDYVNIGGTEYWDGEFFYYDEDEEPYLTRSTLIYEP